LSWIKIPLRLDLQLIDGGHRRSIADAPSREVDRVRGIEGARHGGHQA
jgi:hypothetical protein